MSALAKEFNEASSLNQQKINELLAKQPKVPLKTNIEITPAPTLEPLNETNETEMQTNDASLM